MMMKKKPIAQAIARERRSLAPPKPIGRSRRSSLLSASALLLGGFGAQALAAETSIDLVGETYGSEGNLAITSVLDNVADVTASVVSSTGGIDTQTGSGDDLTLDVDANVIGALATGNSFINEIELNQIDSQAAAPAAVGAASLGVALNTDATISSSVMNSGLNQANVGVSGGSFSVSENLIIAQTTLNAGESTVFGDLPTDFDDDTAGRIGFAFPTAGGVEDLDSEASIAVTSFQLSSEAGASGASLSDNFATLSMDPDTGTDLTLDGTHSVEDNEFSALFRGNVAFNEVPIETGGSPTFEGTVALSNLQGNLLGLAGTGGTASVSGTEVSASLGDARGTEEVTLTGTLSVTDNELLAAATGSQGDSEISLEDGLSFQGSANTAAPGANITTAVGPDQVTADLDADLALLNAQANQGFGVRAAAQDSELSTFATSVDGGTVALDANRIGATASGTTGTSRILAESANDFDGSAALASFQLNEGEFSGGFVFGSVNSLVSDNAVSAEIGDDAALGDQLTSATVSVDETVIEGAATGNQVTNEIALAGNDIDLAQVGAAPTLGSLEGGQEGLSTMDAAAGASLINVQANYDSSTATSLFSNTIGIVAGPGLSTDITDSTLSINDSTVEGTAIGNRAGGNTLSISANELTGSAVLGSVQGIDNVGGEVGAGVSGTEIRVDVGVPGVVAVQDSTVEITGGLIRGLAFGNLATNVVDIDANTASIADSLSPVASTVDLDIAGENQSVNAAYGLLAVQSSNAAANVQVSDSIQEITVADDVIDSTVNLNSNAVVGAAFGNETLNAMMLDANNLAFAADSGPVANVTSAQSFSGDVGATVEFALLQVDAMGDSLDSTLSVSDNLIQVQAAGNRSTADGDLGNTLDVTGNNILALPDAPVSGLSADADGLTADTVFSVQNAQVAGTVLDPASLAAGIEVFSAFQLFAEGDQSGSTLAVDGNAALASGTFNEATNRVALNDITTLEGAAGLNTLQQTVGDASVDNIDTGAYLLANATDGDVTDSSLSVSGNTFQARVQGNLADNTVQVQAANVTVPGNVSAGSVIDNGSGQSDVAAAFGSLNTQTVTGDLSAGTDGVFADLFVDGAGIDSSFNLDDNAISAVAAANTAGSTMDLDLGNLDTAAAGPVGAIASDQTLQGSVQADVEGFFGGMLLDVGAFTDSGVTGSTLSITGNTLQAQAAGNQVLGDNGFGNVLTVTGASLDAGLADAGGLTMDLGGDSQTGDLAFSVQNRQAVDGTGVAANIDEDNFSTITVGDGVTASTLQFSDNVFAATASSNEAGNALEMMDLNAISSSAGVQSYQEVAGPTDATLTLDVDPSGVFSGGDSVADSTLAVTDNRFAASATGNEVRNLLTAAANSIDAGAGQAATGFATETDAGGDQAAVADFAVSNRQVLDAGSDVNAIGANLLAIEAGDDDPLTSVTGSTLLVTGNAQEVRAQGNIASNALNLEATNLGDAVGSGAAGTLISVQEGAASISATSDFGATATGAIEDSSLRIGSNENRAVAILNQAANQASASGTNLFSSAAGSDNAVATTDDANANLRVTADQGVLNIQSATGALVNAEASSTLENRTQVADTRGLQASSVGLSENLTEAQAMANQADTALNLEASSLGVTGGVLNQQASSSDVEAEAFSTVAFVLNAADDVVTGSTVDVSGNTTVAAASANRATNALSAVATSGYANVGTAGATGSVDIGSGAFAADATFAALNTQSNTGSVAATIDGATHAIDLTGAANAVTGSTLAASNNQMLAEASGNFARNTLSLSARPGGNGSAALSNVQSNTGAGISATLSDSGMGVSITGGTGVSGNTASVSGNRGIARASGNTAVNRILSDD